MGIRVTHQRCHTNLHQYPASHTTIETAYQHQSTSNQHHPPCASLCRAWTDQENWNREKKPKKRRRGVSSSRSILLKSSMLLWCPLKLVLISRTDQNVYAQTFRLLIWSILINNSIVFTIVTILWFILINYLICKFIAIQLHLITFNYIYLHLFTFIYLLHLIFVKLLSADLSTSRLLIHIG